MSGARPGAVSRRIKCLTVADDFVYECGDIAADFCIDFCIGFGIDGHYVARLLELAATFRRYLKTVRTNTGPKFTCRTFMTWHKSTTSSTS